MREIHENGKDQAPTACLVGTRGNASADGLSLRIEVAAHEIKSVAGLSLAFGGRSTMVTGMDYFYHGRSPGSAPRRELATLRARADEGDAEAQYHLGVLCHRASMDPTCANETEFRIEAYMWFQLAAAQGYKDSVSAWQRVAMAMTRHEIAEGNRRKAAFVALFAAQAQCS